MFLILFPVMNNPLPEIWNTKLSNFLLFLGIGLTLFLIGKRLDKGVLDFYEGITLDYEAVVSDLEEINEKANLRLEISSLKKIQDSE